MSNPKRVYELLGGLSAINIVDVTEPPPGRLEVTVESVLSEPACPGCRERAWVKDRHVVELADLLVSVDR